MCAAGAADPAGAAWAGDRARPTCGGDERHFLFVAHRLSVDYLPRDSFPPRSTVYNAFRNFQRDGVREAISAKLHMALRERMGREASPLVAALDSQSTTSAEKGAVTTDS